MELNIKNTTDLASEILIIGLPDHLNQLGAVELEGNDIIEELEFLKHQQIVGSQLGKVCSTFYRFNNKNHRLLTVGLGNLKNLQYSDYFKIFGKLFQYLKKEHISEGSLLFESFYNKNMSYDNVAEILGLQAERSVYEFDNYKSNKAQPYKLLLHVHTGDSALKQSIRSGRYLGESINLARRFSNMPPNILTPQYYSTQIAEYFHGTAIDVDIKSGEAIQQEGFGLIHGVGKGSKHSPRLVTLSYNGGDKENPPIALVGKGITYDSGGYSIKSKLGMQTMKYDMCGSANVLGMIAAAAKLELPVNIVGILAIAENMISDAAMKPDDIFTALNGETVEVLNSDAEGRLVLGDAVFYASQFQPQCILDFATLTGAAVVALGEDKAAVFKNNAGTPLNDILKHVALYDEPTFELPITQTEQENIRQSDVADLVNHTNGQGKALFAASFIAHFAGATPHLHFDIAGPATSSKESYNGPAGPTGFLIPSIVSWLRTL
ncbi:leucyl aminopeptidase family protein [Staphylococcus sp. SQ8-PEA]|uniref:Probable cytosol aminopeptidase n=1 Tax=Staphylococcus marylandisciuri TaxID=2981529 RepID=A0ABT2QPP3_9STAP|nr:leucyl aminopeptidase family protein [Staphylococcus marylandisciuri]MCU5745944.1 leucyl aminopeptidase family protein [Staphylococcus marylandisciuri]